jgi:hypothetical protein
MQVGVQNMSANILTTCMRTWVKLGFAQIACVLEQLTQSLTSCIKDHCTLVYTISWKGESD